MSQYGRKLSKGIFYFYKFDLNGKTYFSKAEYKTKQEAKRAEAERLSQISEVQIINNKIPLITAIEERIKYLGLHYSKQYTRSSQKFLKLFYSHFGDVYINDINKTDVHKFIMDYAVLMRSQGFKNYNVNNLICCYKSLFNFVVEHYDISIVNPLTKFKLYPIEKHIKYIPSDEEINAVLNICNKKQSLLIRFIMETGARINECLKLEYKDIMTDYVILYTNKSRNSNRTLRKVPMPECFKNLNKGKATDKVFGDWSERPKFLEWKIKRLNQSQWSYHNLRHRFASKLSKTGVPLFEIMSLLGHSNLETTQIYLQLLP